MATATSPVRTSSISLGTDPGIIASERIQAGCSVWTGSGGGGSGIESKKLIPPA